MKALTNPPIREAIISVSFSEPIGADVMKSFCENDYITQNYPTQNSLVNLTITTKGLGDDEGVKTKHAHEGYTLGNLNNSQKTIQLRLGSLSFHNTMPYLGWEELYDEFKKIWAVLEEMLGSNVLIKANLRYLNEIILDLPLKNGFADYIKLLPAIPHEIGLGLSGFFLQVQIPDISNSMLAVITENLEQPNEKEVKVILDIQVHKMIEFERAGIVFESLSQMREFKNRIFESCLTKEVIKRYE